MFAWLSYLYGNIQLTSYELRDASYYTYKLRLLHK